MKIQVPENIKEQVTTGADVLKKGGVIAYPTDTVYGLGASLKHIDAIRRIYRIKNRSYDMPLPILLGDVSWIPEYVTEISKLATELIDAFLPGGLTLVMRKSDLVPDIVTAGGDTVAVRVPGYRITLSLIQETGVAIIGTSANLSGMPSVLTSDEVNAQIGTEVDYIINAGKCPGGKESTILDVTVEPPEILREGAVSRNEIEEIIND